MSRLRQPYLGSMVLGTASPIRMFLILYYIPQCCRLKESKGAKSNMRSRYGHIGFAGTDMSRGCIDTPCTAVKFRIYVECLQNHQFTSNIEKNRPGVSKSARSCLEKMKVGKTSYYPFPLTPRE